MVNFLRPVGPGSSQDDMVARINKNFGELDRRAIVEFFKDQTGTRRVMLGKGANNFYGLKVSKEGNDVYTATNDQLVFNSDNNVFKIVATGTITAPGYSVADPGAGIWGGGFGQGSLALADIGVSPADRPIIMGFLQPISAVSIMLPWITNSAEAATGFTQRTLSIYQFGTQIHVLDKTMATGTGIAHTIADTEVVYYVLQESTSVT